MSQDLTKEWPTDPLAATLEEPHRTCRFGYFRHVRYIVAPIKSIGQEPSRRFARKTAERSARPSWQNDNTGAVVHILNAVDDWDKIGRAWKAVQHDTTGYGYDSLNPNTAQTFGVQHVCLNMRDMTRSGADDSAFTLKTPRPERQLGQSVAEHSSHCIRNVIH